MIKRDIAKFINELDWDTVKITLYIRSARDTQARESLIVLASILISWRNQLVEVLESVR